MAGGKGGGGGGEESSSREMRTTHHSLVLVHASMYIKWCHKTVNHCGCAVLTSKPLLLIACTPVHAMQSLAVSVLALTAKVRGPRFNPGWLPVFHVSQKIFPSLSSCIT